MKKIITFLLLVYTLSVQAQQYITEKNIQYYADSITAKDPIAALIPFSGQAITHYTIRQERGIKDTQAVIDDYAPVYYVRADAPPTLLITGDREMELLGRYEENAYLLQMMKPTGHKRTTLYELQGFNHGGRQCLLSSYC